MSDPRAATITLAPEVAAQVQSLSDLTTLSPDEIVGRILTTHFARTATPVPVQKPETNAAQVPAPKLAPNPVPVTPPEQPRLSLQYPSPIPPPATPQRILKEQHQVLGQINPARVSLQDIPSFDGIDLKFCSWNGKPIDAPTPESVLDAVLYDFCFKISATQDADIAMIRKHLGLTARRIFSGSAAGKTVVPSCRLAFQKMTDKEIFQAVFKAARSLNTKLSLTFHLTAAALGRPAGSRICLAFDPNELVEAPKLAAAAPEEIGPGACVRVRYADTGDVRQFYIRRTPEDHFLGDGVTEVPAGSPIAKALSQGSTGDSVELQVPPARKRGVVILEVWRVGEAV